jgi:hypothetical protein
MEFISYQLSAVSHQLYAESCMLIASLLFCGHVDRHDATGQVFVRYLLKPSLTEHLAEPFLIGECPD